MTYFRWIKNAPPERRARFATIFEAIEAANAASHLPPAAESLVVAPGTGGDFMAAASTPAGWYYVKECGQVEDLKDYRPKVEP